MNYDIQDIKYVESAWGRFYDVGITESGGVTRLGYTAEEDAMHRIFASLGTELGFEAYEDEVGNTFVSNCGKQEEAFLIGSHLDSVVEGGRFDGVAGILAGLLVMRRIKETGEKIAVRTVAFRCEESSSFGVSTLGSALVTGTVPTAGLAALKGRDGVSLRELFEARGYSLSPPLIDNVREYLEVHIEQGRVLKEYRQRIGIVSTVAGPRRFRLHIQGRAEHSGATPMAIRHDALCAAAEIILEIERIGTEESVRHSVATVGVVEAVPNVINVIPGEVRLDVDIRGVEEHSLDEMERRIKQAGKAICGRRGVGFIREKLSSSRPVAMDHKMQDKLERAASTLGISSRRMISGAGHDAMNLASVCDSALVFIPCKDGVSHNKNEFADMESICDGANLVHEYIRREWVQA